MPKRKAAAAPPEPTPEPMPAVNTLTKYFSSLPPGPTNGPASGPINLFETFEERVHRKMVKLHKKWRSVIVSSACSDGTLKGGCMKGCSRKRVDMAFFAPADESHISAARRQAFDAAYARYVAAFRADNKEEAIEQRALVETLRTDRCTHCSRAGYLSPTQRGCKELFDTFRKEAAAANDGCANPHCHERGDAAWCALQGDHGTNPKRKNAHGEPIGLSAYSEWAAIGNALARDAGKMEPNAGLPFALAAMRAERAQIHQWICAFCHSLEPTGTAGRRYPDPEGMPAGKARGTKEETKQYNARWVAWIVYPKQQYVDERKRAIGCCAACAHPVKPSEEVGFQFHHLVESAKRKGGLFGEQGGVSGLVANCSKKASLEHVRELLDEEMDETMCALLCANCHHRHTNGYPKRAPVAVCAPCMASSSSSSSF